jgi:acyl-coenzyme A thioesterase PaaI-like protein
MKITYIQDLYADDFTHCFGCGKSNPEGHHLKTHLAGDHTISRFTPKPYHIAIPGFVYGGLLASLIDCHGTGSASLFYAKANAIELQPGNAPRFVTANLNVDYKKPTPLNVELTLSGELMEITSKKVITRIQVLVSGDVTVSGTVTAVLLPDNFGK